jgi:hypothetical protein
LYHHAFGLDAIQAALLLRVGLEASGQLDVELIEADELALRPCIKDARLLPLNCHLH